MSTKIEIEDNTVTVDTFGIKTELLITDFVDALSAKSHGLFGNGMFDSGLLPVALRYFDSNMSTFLFERPPGLVSIWYTNAMKEQAKTIDDGNKNIFRLNFPWQVYLLHVNNMSWNMKIYFRNTPITSFDEQVFQIPLPNTAGRDGTFCNSHLYNQELREAQKDGNFTLADSANFLFNFAWTTNFNNNAGGPSSLPVTRDKRSIVPANKTKNWENFLTAWEKTPMQEVLLWKWISAGKLCDKMKPMIDSGKPQNVHSVEALLSKAKIKL